MRKLLQDIIVPTITLYLNATLDLAGLELLVNHLLRGGVNGLAGTTGEGPALSHQMRREMVEHVCIQVGDRIPVIVAALDSSPGTNLEYNCTCNRSRSSAVAVAPPFYMPVSQSDLICYGKSMAEASPLPVLSIMSPMRIFLDLTSAHSNNWRSLTTFTGSRTAAVRVILNRGDTDFQEAPRNLRLGWTRNYLWRLHRAAVHLCNPRRGSDGRLGSRELSKGALKRDFLIPVH